MQETRCLEFCVKRLSARNWLRIRVELNADHYLKNIEAQQAIVNERIQYFIYT